MTGGPRKLEPTRASTKSGHRVAKVASHGRGLAQVIVLLLAASLTNSVTAQSAMDSLRFLDGSRLDGTFLSFTPDKGLVWRHPAAAAEMRIRTDHLHELHFARIANGPESRPPSARFRFANGDELRGELEGFDEHHVWLRSWFAGSLKAARDGLESITFYQRGGSVVYEGPHGLAGWNVSSPEHWTWREGTLAGGQNSFMARTLDLPDRARIQFDIAWQGALNLYVSIYSDSVERFNFVNEGYQFNFGLGYLNVMRGQGRLGMLHLGQARLPPPPPDQPMSFEIRADREKSLLALLVNGQLTGQWNDRAGFVSTNKGISFYGLSSSFQLSNIRVSTWDGEFDDQAATTGTNQLTAPLVKLVNRDRFNARLGRVADGRLKIITEQTELQIPLERVSEIHFPPPVLAPPAAGAVPVQARLAGGDKLTLQLAEWNTGIARGQSTWFGRVQFDSRWVEELRFNPGRQPARHPLPGITDQGLWLFD